ncbi:hypothetical protein HZB01_04200 [Candidatus Woesearchaeota archaeon]|nr:hypothetical protein [Candidatus Woesearchaeota archaeon]
MNEGHLFKIALGCAVAGICILYILAGMLPKDINTQPLSLLEEDQEITVQGIITNISVTNNVTRLIVQRLELVPIISFDRVDAKEGDAILIKGKVQSYREKKEIIAEKTYTNSSSPSK